jgi:predicted Fe-Mo cluster-binding NifX family protein
MKIAIPVIDKDLQRNRIAGSLSVIGCLCIYDTEMQEGRWMKTLDLAPNMGELLPAFERNNISIIITKQVHPMALKVLVSKGIEVFKSVGDELDTNIHFLNNNELIPFDMEAAMKFAAVCGGECGDCKTECEDEKKETPNP